MKWNEYYDNYMELAKLKGKSDYYCIEQLNYAKNLFDNNVPIIYNQYHFSELVGYELEYLLSVSNKPSKFYRTFKLKKKNGKFREINEPLPSLKEIQRWILDEIISKIKISDFSKAYIKNKSIKDNAKFHRNQKIILSMDIKDFFPSINYQKVFNIFKNIGYKDSVAVLLSNICCLDNKLPQGAPTSPYISNIILKSLDEEIANYVIDKKIRYTRYADDLTFSGDFIVPIVINKVSNIIKKNGFSINANKTRTRKQHQRQEVSGITVNQKLQLSRKERRKLRSDIYYIKKYGLESHKNYTNITKKNYLYHMIGKVSHGLFINSSDEQLKKQFYFLKSLLYEKDNTQ